MSIIIQQHSLGNRAFDPLSLLYLNCLLLDNIINAAEASSIHHCFAAAAIDCQLPRTHKLYVR